MLAALTRHGNPGIDSRSGPRRMRSKIPALTEALTGRFPPITVLIRFTWDLIDQYGRRLADLDVRNRRGDGTFSAARELLISIPGVLQDRR